MDLTDYRFSQTHEWVLADGAKARTGISEYAQSQLGDVIYVELPKVGAEVSAGGKFGVIESVKAASDLYSPVSGRVVQVNEALTTKPEAVNQDPYGEGWMLMIETTEPPSSELLDEAGYKSFVEGL
ncbi:MAG: glycine cleavage system protein GcvH, partial [Candidatus Dormibacteraeota bacterium]|nr:glycine cleavage system protein GcvH [Candidatus Dormibacteraeota bacterium]